MSLALSKLFADLMTAGTATTATAAYGLVGGNFYHQRGPQSLTAPCIVYNVVLSEPDRRFGAVSANSERAEIQIDIYTPQHASVGATESREQQAIKIADQVYNQIEKARINDGTNYLSLLALTRGEQLDETDAFRVMIRAEAHLST